VLWFLSYINMVCCDKCCKPIAVPTYHCVACKEYYCSLECAKRMAVPIKGYMWECHICFLDDHDD
jgi:hypothetical protein